MILKEGHKKASKKEAFLILEYPAFTQAAQYLRVVLLYQSVRISQLL
jgi:hypothetical protein